MSIRIPERPLQIPARAGVRIIERYQLFLEALRLGDEALAECPERVLSGHAPFTARLGDDQVRLNYASENAEFREQSLRAIELFIDKMAQYPNCRLIVVHPSPHFWREDGAEKYDEAREVGKWDIMIDGLKRLNKKCADKGYTLAVENMRVYWDDLETEYDAERDQGKVAEFFGTSPREWVKIVEDVDSDNTRLCLDTSHVTTYAHRFAEEARRGIIDMFILLGGERIAHVHWSDNFMTDPRGREDSHAVLGRGDIPRDFHRNIWEIESAKSYMLEHWEGEGELAFERRFIERL